MHKKRIVPGFMQAPASLHFLEILMMNIGPKYVLMDMLP